MEEFLEDNIAPDNCIQIWRHATQMKDLGQLEEKANRYILDHFFHEDIQERQPTAVPELPNNTFKHSSFKLV